MAFCPAGVLEQDESGIPYVKDPERCTGCQLCELRCPDFAINLRSPRSKEGKKAVRKGEEAEEGTNG